MKLALAGQETIAADAAALWGALNDPEVLTRCIPGCKSMTATGPDAYVIAMELKVAAVRGGFGGTIELTDRIEPQSCRVTVSGSGSLGNGTGRAEFVLTPLEDGQTRLAYSGEGEIGGLVAGVGQRVLKAVAQHLVGKFFAALRQDFADRGMQVAS